MKTKVIRIGNSRGVRLPKTLIEEAGLQKEVDIIARQGRIIISPIGKPRSGWDESAKQLHALGQDRLLDEVTGTSFDAKDWNW
jgi:antitoxin MazE